MDNVILAYYLGLLMFSLLGLQAIHLQSKLRAIKVEHERIRRLLMRSKLRRKQ